MPSSDVTTRKPGSDFDWLIVEILAGLSFDMQRIAYLGGELKNFDNLYREQQNCPCLRSYDLLDEQYEWRIMAKSW